MDPDLLDIVASGHDHARNGHHAATSDGTLGADLTAALERLPEEYRSVVVLADVEDLTMAEVAAVMGCPVGTVKSRLFRARAALQDLLRDYAR